MHGISKPYLRASYHVYKIGCLLVRGISLPVAQLFVIAIENILREVCGQFNKSLRGRELLKSCRGHTYMQILGQVTRTHYSMQQY